MSELREAAQEALFWMQHARLHLTIKERLHPDGLIQYDNAARNLRAALAQPEALPPRDVEPPTPIELAKKLRYLSNDIMVLSAEIQYVGGFGQMANIASAMELSARNLRAWAYDIEEAQG